MGTCLILYRSCGVRGRIGRQSDCKTIPPWTGSFLLEILCLSERKGEAQDGARIGEGESETAKKPGLTWVSCIAGDTSALKLVGKLPGKQHIGQLTVGVCPQLLLPAYNGTVQAGEVKTSTSVGSRGYYHHTAGCTCLQPGQQQVCQQEGAHVVHPQQQIEGLPSPATGADPWERSWL